ncbi:MAG: hypothetical protein RQ826_15365 [Xanthomonadales bacterium]|nr:hypothetical protein [Xanthomonadales bacterium]
MTRKPTDKEPKARHGVSLKRHSTKPRSDEPVEASSASESHNGARKNGGWREIEALREKAALKAFLADVWDEDFDLDAEILAALDHTAEFFTDGGDDEEESFEDGEEIGEFYDDDDEI